MNTSELVLLIGSILIVGVIFLTNRKKRYGSRPLVKDPNEKPSDYAAKKHPPA